MHRVLVNWDPPISQVVDLPGTIQNCITSIYNINMKRKLKQWHWALLLVLLLAAATALVRAVLFHPMFAVGDGVARRRPPRRTAGGERKVAERTAGGGAGRSATRSTGPNVGGGGGVSSSIERSRPKPGLRTGRDARQTTNSGELPNSDPKKIAAVAAVATAQPKQTPDTPMPAPPQSPEFLEQVSRARIHGLKVALAKWDFVAGQHDIAYRIDFETLRGWMVDDKISPHAPALVIAIGAESFPTLQALAWSNEDATSFFMDAGNRPLASSHQINAGALPNSYMMQSARRHRSEAYSVVALVRGGSATKDPAGVETECDGCRMNCEGKRVHRGEPARDVCTFSKPVARVIYFPTFLGFAFDNKINAHIDVVLAGCPFVHEHEQEWACSSRARECKYCPLAMAKEFALQMPHFGDGLRRCTLSGVATWCPKDRVWCKERASALWGDSWMHAHPHPGGRNT